MPESTNPKRENLLNLALDATGQELEKSPELQVGYDREQDTWELIIRYSADLEGLRREYPQISIVELLNGYAVVTLPRMLMGVFTDRIEVEYIEKPKRLFFAVDQGIRASCITPVQTSFFGLSGKGVLCGLADSGERVRIMEKICSAGIGRSAGGIRFGKYMYRKKAGRCCQQKNLPKCSIWILWN